MRLILLAFLCLGILVMTLAIFEQAVQTNKRSTVITSAHKAGALQNAEFADRLRWSLETSPVTFIIAGAGLAITLLALWRLNVETRP